MKEAHKGKEEVGQEKGETQKKRRENKERKELRRNIYSANTRIHVCEAIYEEQFCYFLNINHIW